MGYYSIIQIFRPGVTVTLSNATSAGATSFALSDASAIVAGDTLRLDVGQYTDYLTVATVSGSTVTTTTAAANAHSAGSNVFRPGPFTKTPNTPALLLDIEADADQSDTNSAASRGTYEVDWYWLQQGGLDQGVFYLHKKYEDALDIAFGNYIVFACQGGTLASAAAVGASSVSVANLAANSNLTTGLNLLDIQANDPILISDGVNSEIFLASAISGSGPWTITLAAAPGAGNAALLNAYGTNAKVCRLRYQGIIQNRVRDTDKTNLFQINAIGVFNRYGNAVGNSTASQVDGAGLLSDIANSYVNTLPEIIVNSSNLAASSIPVTVSEQDATVSQIMADILKQESAMVPSQSNNGLTISPTLLDFPQVTSATQEAKVHGGNAPYTASSANPAIAQVSLIGSDAVNTTTLKNTIGVGATNFVVNTTTKTINGTQTTSNTGSLAAGDLLLLDGGTEYAEFVYIASVNSTTSTITLTSGTTYSHSAGASVTQYLRVVVTTTGNGITTITVTDGGSLTVTLQVAVNSTLRAMAGTVFAAWCDELRQLHHAVIPTSGNPTYTMDLKTGSSNGDILGPLQTTDMDGSSLINAAVVRGGTDANGNRLRIDVIENYSQQLLNAWYEGTLDNSDITDESSLAQWAASQLAILAYPIITATLDLTNASMRLTTADLLQITGFDDGSTLLCNPIQIQYQAIAAEQRVISTVTLGVLGPDATSVAAEYAREKAIRESYVGTTTNLTQTYVVSGFAFTETGADNFTISAGSLIFQGTAYSASATNETAPVGDSLWGVSVVNGIASISQMPALRVLGSQSATAQYAISYRGGPATYLAGGSNFVPLYKVSASSSGILNYTYVGPSGGVASNNLNTGTASGQISIDTLPDNVHAKVLGSHVVNGVAYNYKGVWSSATAYVQGDEVVYGPSYWIALAGSTNSAPTTGNANWQVVGTYSGYQGAWSSTTAYVAGAEVTYSGNYWVCVAANTNSAPSTSNANWQIAGPSSLDNIADGSGRFAVGEVDANHKAIIDFNSSHLNQGALSKKNQADLTSDVVNILPLANHAVTIQTQNALAQSQSKGVNLLDNADFLQAAVSGSGDLVAGWYIGENDNSTFQFLTESPFSAPPTAGNDVVIRTPANISIPAHTTRTGIVQMRRLISLPPGQNVVLSCWMRNDNNIATPAGLTVSQKVDGWVKFSDGTNAYFGPTGLSGSSSVWIQYGQNTVCAIPSPASGQTITAIEIRFYLQVTNTTGAAVSTPNGLMCDARFNTPSLSRMVSYAELHTSVQNVVDSAGTLDVSTARTGKILPRANTDSTITNAIDSSGRHVGTLFDGTNSRTIANVTTAIDGSGRVVGSIYDGTTTLTPGNVTSVITPSGTVDVSKPKSGVTLPRSAHDASITNAIDASSRLVGSIYDGTTALTPGNVTSVVTTSGTVDVSKPKTGVTLPRSAHDASLTNAIDASSRLVGNVFDGTTALTPANLTTAVDTSGNVKNLGGTAAASITPIAGLMPQEAGANVTENRYAAGTGSGSNQRTAAAMAANMDANGNSLLVEFAGGKLQADGSLTNINAAQAKWSFTPINNGSAVHIEGIFQSGSYASPQGFLLGSNTSTAYGVYHDGSGYAYLLRLNAGTQTNLGTILNAPSDGNPHFIALTITFNNDGSRTLEATIDSQTTYYVDPSGSSLSFVPNGNLDIFAYTGNATGSIRSLKASAGTHHYSQMHPTYQGNFDSSGNLSNSGGLTKNGAVVPVVSTSGISYTSSTGSSGTGQSTINLYWDGTNNSSIPTYHPPASGVGVFTSVTGANQAIAGLNASSTYYYCFRINMASNVLESRPQSGGSNTDKTDESWLNLDGYCAFAKNLACSTPAVNTGGGGGLPPGGGGGGNSCPAIDQVLETKRGFIAAGEIAAGDFVRDLDGDWNEVYASQSFPAQIAEIAIAGEVLRVDSQHQWMTPDGGWIDTMQLHLGKLLQGADGRLYPVEGLRLCGEGMMQKLVVHRKRFVIGRVVGHNTTTL